MDAFVLLKCSNNGSVLLKCEHESCVAIGWIDDAIPMDDDNLNYAFNFCLYRWNFKSWQTRNMMHIAKGDKAPPPEESIIDVASKYGLYPLCGLAATIAISKEVRFFACLGKSLKHRATA